MTPNGKFLYVATTPGLVQFAINSDGSLTSIGSLVAFTSPPIVMNIDPSGHVPVRAQCEFQHGEHLPDKREHGSAHGRAAGGGCQRSYGDCDDAVGEMITIR